MGLSGSNTDCGNASSKALHLQDWSDSATVLLSDRTETAVEIVQLWIFNNSNIQRYLVSFLLEISKNKCTIIGSRR